MEFKVGDKVRIKKDLLIDKLYYNEDRTKSDYFTYRMEKFLGKESVIVEINDKGYVLEIDTMHTYTHEMIEKPYDELAKEDYTFDYEVESVIENSKREFYERQLDKALEERLFETDPERFDELMKLYNSTKWKV